MTNSPASTEIVINKALREKLRTRTKIFLTAYVVLNSVAMFIHIFTSSYFNYKLTEVLSLHTSDGWCAPSIQGIGDHCFGDFYYSLRFANLQHPWSADPVTAPPFANFIFKPFANAVLKNPATSLPLKVYLFILVVATLVPVLHAFYTKKTSATISILMVAMILNIGPFLVGVDRGNYILLCIPLLYFFYIGIFDSRVNLTLFIGLLLVSFKPQMILLGFIFFASHQWKMGIKWLGITIGGTLLSFALYPHGLFQNISDFANQLLKYRDYAHQGDLLPVNVSFSNTLSIFSKWIVKRPLSGSSVTFVSLLVCVIACISLVVLGKYRSTFHNLLIVTFLPILVPGVSFNYYLVLLLVPLLFLVSDYVAIGDAAQEEIRTMPNFFFSSMRIFDSRWIGTLFAATYVLLLIPWALPWSLFVNTLQGSPPPLIGANWAIGQFFLVILFVALLFSAD